MLFRSLQVELITGDPGPGPFGAKSVGELANPAVGAAVANAVQDAVGVRVWSLPITAEKIWAELTRPDEVMREVIGSAED